MALHGWHKGTPIEPITIHSYTIVSSALAMALLSRAYGRSPIHASIQHPSVPLYARIGAPTGMLYGRVFPLPGALSLRALSCLLSRARVSSCVHRAMAWKGRQLLLRSLLSAIRVSVGVVVCLPPVFAFGPSVGQGVVGLSRFLVWDRWALWGPGWMGSPLVEAGGL